MVIKNVSLDIVCGITSKLPTQEDLKSLLQGNPMWENPPSLTV